MKLRTHVCIALVILGNWQGSTLCFDLDIGKVVTSRMAKKPPMPNRVVKRVNMLGKSKRGIKYLDRVEFLNPKCQPFEWENEEIRDTLPTIDEPIYLDILDEIP